VATRPTMTPYDDAVPRLKNLLPGEHAAAVADAPLVGVLALQGAFAEHAHALGRLGARVREVRNRADLGDDLAGLVIPGGESTTMAIVARTLDLVEPLQKFVADGRPVFGTCAGLIFLSDHVTGQKKGGQSVIGGLDVLVHRNFFGSQVDSCERTVELSEGVRAGELAADHPHVFIRAPAILKAGPGVQVLATVGARGQEQARTRDAVREAGHGDGLEAEDRDVIVAVQQGHILATAFHPELTDDLTWHAHFLAMVRGGAKPAAGAKAAARAKAARAAKEGEKETSGRVEEPAAQAAPAKRSRRR